MFTVNHREDMQCSTEEAADQFRGWIVASRTFILKRSSYTQPRSGLKVYVIPFQGDISPDFRLPKVLSYSKSMEGYYMFTCSWELLADSSGPNLSSLNSWSSSVDS